MKQIFLIGAGFVALALGMLGVLLPILPTTPFVLVAAACFGGGSPRLHQWLRSSRYFGEFIDNYENKTGVTHRTKTKALVFLWGALLLSAVLAPRPLVWGILLTVGVGVSVHIALLRLKP